MWRVTGDAAFRFQRCMFIDERTLLVGMTLNARGVGTDSETRLLEFKTTMGVVTIAALHRPFKNLVMEGHVERGLYLTMTSGTKLWFPASEQVDGSEARLLNICRGHALDRTRHISFRRN